MSVEPKDILALLPTAVGVVKDLAGLVSNRAAVAVGFGGEVAALVIQLEQDGATPEAISQAVADLSVQLILRIKYGT